MDPDLEKAKGNKEQTEISAIKTSAAESNGSLKSSSSRGSDYKASSLPDSSRSSQSAVAAGCWTVPQAQKVHLDPNDPGHWAVNHHLENLILEVKPVTWHSFSGLLNIFSTIRSRHEKAHQVSAPSTSQDRRFRINFAELQRMRVRKLQCKLIGDVIYMRHYGCEADGWEANLEEYVKALQSHDYMEQRSKSRRDPFIASGEYLVDKYVFDRSLSSELRRQAFGLVSSACDWEKDKDHAQTICGTRDENLSTIWFKNFRRRVAVAGIGGVYLIGPMWLMVLHNTLYTVLITTTVFVAAFGFTMACYLDAERDVLASTAAYAAVLIVFVGASVTTVSAPQNS